VSNIRVQRAAGAMESGEIGMAMRTTYCIYEKWRLAIGIAGMSKTLE
jgi:hypothetical protein